MAGIYYRPQFYSYGMKSPYIIDPRMVSPYTTSPERLDAIPVFKPHITVLSHHSNGLDVDSIKILVEGFGVDNGDIVMTDGRVYSPEEFITCLYVKSNLYIGTDDKHRDYFATFKPGDRISHRILNYEDMIQGNRLKIEIKVDLAKPCKYQWMTSNGYIGVEEKMMESLIIVIPDFSEVFTIDCDETLFYDGHGKPYGAQTYKTKRPVILYDIHGVRITETAKEDENISKEESPIEICDILSLKNDVAEGFEPITKKFKVISYIEKVGEIPIDSYIMKQVEGPVSTIFSLTKYDCKELGIQYEKGLQLFPKNLNWINPNAATIEKEKTKSNDMMWAYNPMTQCLEVSSEDGKLNTTFAINSVPHMVSKWEMADFGETKDINKIKLVLEKKNDPIFSYYHMKQNGKQIGKIIVHRYHLLQSVSYNDNRQQYVFSVKDTYGRTFEVFFLKNEIENSIINL